MLKSDLIINELYILSNSINDLYIVQNLDNIYGRVIKTLYINTFRQINDTILLDFYIMDKTSKEIPQCRPLSKLEKLKYL